ncbi:hypothetical protein PWG11_17975 (plasmid) [Proteus mirabilis]|uniref:hypothetical protein n=1 Tax=Proteus mirabilis TaxID=584 RepID=UPI0038F6D4AF
MLNKKLKVLVVLFIKALAALMSFYVGVVVANELSFDCSSKYFYSLNISMMIGSLSTLGLKNYILQINGVDNNQDVNVRNCLTVVLFLSLVALLFLSPIIIFYSNDKSDFLSILILAFAFLYQSLSVSYLYSMQKQVMGVIFETILPYGIIVLGIKLSILSDFTTISLVLSITIIALSLLSLLTGNSTFGAFSKLKIDLVKSFIRSKDFRSYAMLMFLGAIVSYFPTQVGSFLISTKEITFLLVAIKISSILRVFYTALVSIYAPKISSLYRLGKIEEYKQVVLSSTLILSIFGISGSLAIHIFSTEIIALYGNDYNPVKEFLPWILIFQCLFISTGVVGHALMMTEKAYRLRNSLVSSLIINFPLAIVFGYFFGAVGVAIGYGILLFGQHLFAAISLYKYTGINVLKFYKEANGLL